MKKSYFLKIFEVEPLIHGLPHLESYKGVLIP